VNGQINIFVLAALAILLAIACGIAWGLALLLNIEPRTVVAVVFNVLFWGFVVLTLWARFIWKPDA